MTVKSLLAADIKKIRNQAMKSRAEMSEASGLSVAKIANIENDKFTSLEDFLIYADSLGYTVELKKKKAPTIIMMTSDGKITGVM